METKQPFRIEISRRSEEKEPIQMSFASAVLATLQEQHDRETTLKYANRGASVVLSGKTADPEAFKKTISEIQLPEGAEWSP